MTGRRAFHNVGILKGNIYIFGGVEDVGAQPVGKLLCLRTDRGIEGELQWTVI